MELLTLECPDCGHSFKPPRESIIPFRTFLQWDNYVRSNMRKGERYLEGKETKVYAGKRTIARWDGIDYGYVSERRIDHLTRMVWR